MSRKITVNAEIVDKYRKLIVFIYKSDLCRSALQRMYLSLWTKEGIRKGMKSSKFGDINIGFLCLSGR